MVNANSLTDLKRLLSRLLPGERCPTVVSGKTSTEKWTGYPKCLLTMDTHTTSFPVWSNALQTSGIIRKTTYRSFRLATKLIHIKCLMSTSYKTEERIIKGIIKRNVKPINEGNRLNLVIFYKNNWISNLIMRNNTTPVRPLLQRSHAVYKFVCQHEDCGPHASYIGMTTTKVSRRLTLHLFSGKNHYSNRHQRRLTREGLVKVTSIVTTEKDHKRLAIIEALHIKHSNSDMNKQLQDLQILPSSKAMIAHFHVDDVHSSTSQRGEQLTTPRRG
ncbi:uncharacterized protein LOC143031066 [Oratosquilla oratoria]|uniref:uncharacterized protein LOC143031066 n=1 Tax=Oratosquilla oratoria TaxID=337810 RepID=UPI003F76995D